MLKNKCHLRREDKVKIIAGKDKGKVGKIQKIIRKKNRVIVENINMIKRHTKAGANNKQGGIVEREAPIHRSNIMLLCNKCMAPVRIKMHILEDKKKVRVCRKCNEIIDA